MIFRLYSGLLYVWRVRVWLPTIVQINTIGLFKYYNLYNVSRVTRVDIKWYTVKRVDASFMDTRLWLGIEKAEKVVISRITSMFYQRLC